MAELNFDKDKLEEACGSMLAACNDEFIESFDKLASVLKNSDGTDQRLQDVYDKCAQVQQMYNDGGFKAGLDNFVRQLQATFNLSEKMAQKANMEVKKADVGYHGPQIQQDIL